MLSCCSAHVGDGQSLLCTILGILLQAASCTLEAGVKIYSYRVDSVHNDAFKTLAGFSRAALPASQDEGEDGEGEDAGKPVCCTWVFRASHRQRVVMSFTEICCTWPNMRSAQQLDGLSQATDLPHQHQLPSAESAALLVWGYVVDLCAMQRGRRASRAGPGASAAPRQTPTPQPPWSPPGRR